MDKFTKEDTRLLKGVAIILMFSHHLFSFPKRVLTDGYPISFTRIEGMDTAKYIGDFGQICVAVFLFLAGYGMYLSYREKECYVVQKLYGIYTKLWKIMILFVPIGLLFCRNQIAYCNDQNVYNAFHSISLKKLVSNMLGISCGYNQEWWFLRVYVVAMIAFPLVVRLIKKLSVWQNLWGLIVYTLVITTIFPSLHEVPIIKELSEKFLYWNFIEHNANMSCFWMGCILAKDGLLERCIAKYRLLHMNTIAKDFAAIVMIVVCRNSLIGTDFDFIYVPLLVIICKDLLTRQKTVQAFFMAIGAQSTNMWLTHSFFCYYFYRAVIIVFMPRYAILILPWLVLISFYVSKGIDLFYLGIERLTEVRFNQKLQSEI